MNKNVPVKIKTASQANRQDIKKALNLNKVLSDARDFKPAGKNRFWPIFASVIFAVSLVLAARVWWLESRDFSVYQKIIPPRAKTVVFLKISQIKDAAALLAPGLEQLEQNSAFFPSLKERANQFLTEAGVSFQNELTPLLKEEAAFLILPSDSSNGQDWAIIAQKTSAKGQEKQKTFDKIESGLRKKFALNEMLYRQIKINIVYSFNRPENPYYYSQINDFIVLANSQDSLELIIDKITDKWGF